jgi:hypothetical protein
MRRDVAQALASKVRYSKYNFWTEFTALAAVSRYKIVEVPVSYRNRQSGGSRVYGGGKLAKVVLNEFAAILGTWIRSKTKPPARTKNKLKYPPPVDLPKSASL